MGRAVTAAAPGRVEALHDTVTAALGADRAMRRPRSSVGNRDRMQKGKEHPLNTRDRGGVCRTGGPQHSKRAFPAISRDRYCKAWRTSFDSGPPPPRLPGAHAEWRGGLD